VGYGVSGIGRGVGECVGSGVGGSVGGNFVLITCIEVWTDQIDQFDRQDRPCMALYLMILSPVRIHLELH
jgi:hypothetical protein